MAPRSYDQDDGPTPTSQSIHRLPVSDRPDHFLKGAKAWMSGRRRDDGAEGLWRIHNGLYDLSEWAKKHPGGASWITETKGMDITELFESHHITPTAEKMLPKFHVREAATQRNSTLTFHEDGFYRTLKRRINEELKHLPKPSYNRSKLISDCLLAATFTFAVLAAATQSYFFIVLTALFLAWSTVCAHNFFHQKDNWRMYQFNLSLLNYSYWRISHVMSHHMYPNSMADLELSMLEPFMRYLPQEKGLLKYAAWFYSPVVLASFYLAQYLQRLIPIFTSGKFYNLRPSDFIPFTIPLSMILLSGATVDACLMTWLYIILLSSFMFGFIGLTAAHHHPDIFHAGDKPREDRDWGKFQVDTVGDRVDINGSLFLVLTHFGDHCLHHLFPVVDHSLLEQLYPAFEEVCKQFGIEHRMSSIKELTKGQFQQLLREEPNPNPPGK